MLRKQIIYFFALLNSLRGFFATLAAKNKFSIGGVTGLLGVSRTRLNTAYALISFNHSNEATIGLLFRGKTDGYSKGFEVGRDNSSNTYVNYKSNNYQ